MTDPVKAACEACFAANKGDCSAFARAVAARLDVPLAGLADAIADVLRSGPGWTPLPDGVAAAASARDGKLVLGALKGKEQAHPNAHGHVVVVVDGPLAREAYPSAYWGSLGGTPAQDKTVNFAWVAEDRDRVSYAAHDIPAAG
ncbi:MAG: hypothetical protein WDN25_31090 [Acetobacteraceae bacterium]